MSAAPEAISFSPDPSALPTVHSPTGHRAAGDQALFVTVSLVGAFQFAKRSGRPSVHVHFKTTVLNLSAEINSSAALSC